ncbi:MAG: hypothetical protein WDM96_18555 [Lacunisphaera sp.]
MSRLAQSGEIEVDSIHYGWELRHDAGAPSPFANAQGASVSVFLPERKNKELVIDFDIEDPFFTRPRPKREFETRLIACTRGALAQGWNPEARGKPFRVTAAEAEEAS